MMKYIPVVCSVVVVDEGAAVPGTVVKTGVEVVSSVTGVVSGPSVVTSDITATVVVAAGGSEIGINNDTQVDKISFY